MASNAKKPVPQEALQSLGEKKKVGAKALASVGPQAPSPSRPLYLSSQNSGSATPGPIYQLAFLSEGMHQFPISELKRRHHASLASWGCGLTGQLQETEPRK